MLPTWEMVMATLRWMGVPEAEVRMVEGTYEKTTARVVVGEGASEEFEVKIGLRQGSVLSPLLFIAVLDLISRKTVVKDAMKKLLYAEDLALVANGKQELQETLEEWNGLFTRHGLKINERRRTAVHSSTGPHQQEDGGEGCHEETPLCRRPGPGGEWQTGATGDTGGVEWAVYQTRAEN